MFELKVTCSPPAVAAQTSQLNKYKRQRSSVILILRWLSETNVIRRRNCWVFFYFSILFYFLALIRKWRHPAPETARAVLGPAPAPSGFHLWTKCGRFSEASAAAPAAHVAPSAAVLRSCPLPGSGAPSWTSSGRNMDTSWFRPPRSDPEETPASCLSTLGWTRCVDRDRDPDPDPDPDRVGPLSTRK